MTILDWIIVVLLGGFFVRGFFRGFLVEMFALLGLLGGYLAARFLAPFVSLKIAEAVNMPTWIAGFVAMILLFTGVALGFQIVARMLRAAAKAASLGTIDRVAGGIFGAMKATIIVLGVLLLLVITPMQKHIQTYCDKGKVSKYACMAAGSVRKQLKLDDVKLKIPVLNFDKMFQDAGFGDDLTKLISGNDELKDALSKKLPDLKGAMGSAKSGKAPVANPNWNANLSTQQRERLNRIINDPNVNADIKADDIMKVYQEQMNKARGYTSGQN